MVAECFGHVYTLGPWCMPNGLLWWLFLSMCKFLLEPRLVGSIYLKSSKTSCYGRTSLLCQS